MALWKVRLGRPRTDCLKPLLPIFCDWQLTTRCCSCSKMRTGSIRRATSSWLRLSAGCRTHGFSSSSRIDQSGCPYFRNMITSPYCNLTGSGGRTAPSWFGRLLDRWSRKELSSALSHALKVFRCLLRNWRGRWWEAASILRSKRFPRRFKHHCFSRIDRLPDHAKRIAQIGSVVGREFTPELMSVAADIPLADMEAGLDALALSEIVNASSRFGRGRFAFKHVLMQEAAYSSLLRSKRQELHGRIADWMLDNLSRASPEELARHLSAAGRHESAASAWTKAGSVAQSRSAMVEAATAFEKAIEELHHLPSSDDVKRQEFDLLMLLSVAVLNRHGPASKEAERVHRRASSLAAELEERVSWFRVQWGLWRIHNVRADF